MKIAIITFSDFNTNYGSILQTYALKMFCESLGHEVVNIRYREFNDIHYSLVGKLKSSARSLYNCLFSRRREERYSNFQRFINQHISHTELFTSEEILEKHLPVFDAYVCGSDQIWNLPVLGGLRAPYFLKFAPSGKLKIAYAPSMGEYKLDDSHREEVLYLLQSFNNISTREINSATILSTELGRTVPYVADPTLLIDADAWRGAVNPIAIPKGDYGVCYFVRRNKLGNTLVKLLKKKYNIPIYNISDGTINVPNTNNKYVTGGPDTFVNLISNARFCVGTSFHLAAFSVIFNKECYIAGSAHNRDRVSSLFDISGRHDFLVFNKTDAKRLVNDYDGTKKDTTALKEFIKKSKEYLCQSLRM